MLIDDYLYWTTMFYSKYSFNVALGSCFVKHFRNDTFDRNKTNKICHAPLYFFTQCIYGKRCKTLNYLHCASQKPSLSTMYVNFGLSIITSKVRQIISVMKTETLTRGDSFVSLLDILCALVRSPWSDMKASIRAGHILSPSLQPSAVGRATELCPAIPETFLSLQGDLTILAFTDPKLLFKSVHSVLETYLELLVVKSG